MWEKQAQEGVWGTTLSGALSVGSPVPMPHPPWQACLHSPQVMNMYGDLVMDTVPEKVGLTRYFSPWKNFGSFKQLFQSLSCLPFYIKRVFLSVEVVEGNLLNSNL